MRAVRLGVMSERASCVSAAGLTRTRPIARRPRLACTGVCGAVHCEEAGRAVRARGGWVSGYRACGCAGYAVVRAFREPDRGAIGIADGDADGDAECDADGRAERRTHLVAI